MIIYLQRGRANIHEQRATAEKVWNIPQTCSGKTSELRNLEAYQGRKLCQRLKIIHFQQSPVRLIVRIDISKRLTPFQNFNIFGLRRWTMRRRATFFLALAKLAGWPGHRRSSVRNLTYPGFPGAPPTNSPFNQRTCDELGDRLHESDPPHAPFPPSRKEQSMMSMTSAHFPRPPRPVPTVVPPFPVAFSVLRAPSLRDGTPNQSPGASDPRFPHQRGD